MQALRAYQITSGYETALECLVERCGIDPNQTFYAHPSKRFFFGSMSRPESPTMIMAVAALIVVGVILSLVVVRMGRQKKSHDVGKSMALLDGGHSNDDAAAKEVTKRGIFS